MCFLDFLYAGLLLSLPTGRLSPEQEGSGAHALEGPAGAPSGPSHLVRRPQAKGWAPPLRPFQMHSGCLEHGHFLPDGLHLFPGSVSNSGCWWVVCRELGLRGWREGQGVPRTSTPEVRAGSPTHHIPAQSSRGSQNAMLFWSFQKSVKVASGFVW